MTTLHFLIVLFFTIVRLNECAIIQRKCGEIQTYTVDNRTSTIYIPSFVCNKESYLEFFSINNETLTQILLPIPIIIALHGLSNDIYKFIQEYTILNTTAEQYGFIVIAPVGLDKSWNGLYCCGNSVTQNINDLQFIKNVITESIANISTLFNDIMTINKENIQLFVTGMSNGGFMTDEIGWSYALGEHFPFPITAFAPYLGYIYDVNDVQQQMSINSTVYIHKTVPIFFQHGDTDKAVNINGCCHTQTCLVPGIDTFKENCTSLYDEYKKWLIWNHCNENITFDSIAQIFQRQYSPNQLLKCATATPQYDGCDEITKMCVFMDSGHHAQISPNREDYQTNLLLFFYEIMCLKYNGTWEIETNYSAYCMCYNKERLLYCMDISMYMVDEHMYTLSPTLSPTDVIEEMSMSPTLSLTNVIGENMSTSITQSLTALESIDKGSGIGRYNKYIFFGYLFCCCFPIYEIIVKNLI
eukprot:204934_1